jgi:CRP-like cAMP-binding protein
MFNIALYYFTSKPVLDLLPQDDRDRLDKIVSIKRLKKGKTLFQEGATPKFVYVIKSGRVKLFQQSADGSQKMIYLYTAGEMFGYRPLLSDDRHPASAVTVEDSTVYHISAKDFIKFLKRSTHLSNLLLRNLSHEFSVLVNRIGVFSQTSVKERTALSLLIFSEKYRKQSDLEPEIGLSRHDLAAIVGTTVETRARIITHFREDKLIRTKGRKIVLIDRKSLVKLAE